MNYRHFDITCASLSLDGLLAALHCFLPLARQNDTEFVAKVVLEIYESCVRIDLFRSCLRQSACYIIYHAKCAIHKFYLRNAYPILRLQTECLTATYLKPIYVICAHICDMCVIFYVTMFGDPRFLSIRSRLVGIGCPRFDGMLQNRFALSQIRLDIGHEFFGFRLEAARHVAHMTCRDVCGDFRALCYVIRIYLLSKLAEIKKIRNTL